MINIRYPDRMGSGIFPVSCIVDILREDFGRIQKRQICISIQITQNQKSTIFSIYRNIEFFPSKQSSFLVCYFQARTIQTGTCSYIIFQISIKSQRINFCILTSSCLVPIPQVFKIFLTNILGLSNSRYNTQCIILSYALPLNGINFYLVRIHVIVSSELFHTGRTQQCSQHSYRQQ